jgi:hypothetical protein
MVVNFRTYRISQKNTQAESKKKKKRERGAINRCAAGKDLYNVMSISEEKG